MSKDGTETESKGWISGPLLEEVLRAFREADASGSQLPIVYALDEPIRQKVDRKARLWGLDPDALLDIVRDEMERRLKKAGRDPDGTPCIGMLWTIFKYSAMEGRRRLTDARKKQAVNVPTFTDDLLSKIAKKTKGDFRWAYGALVECIRDALTVAEATIIDNIYYTKKLTQPELATLLDVAEKTIRNRRDAALVKLEACIQKKLGDL